MNARRTCLLLPAVAILMAGALGAAEIKLEDYAAKGNWAEGETRFARGIVALCPKGKLPTFTHLRPLAYAWLVCREFQRVGDNTVASVEQKKLVNWLLKRPAFTERFLLALSPRDNRGRAFEILHALRKRSAKDTGRHGELAAAFAVVWDEPGLDAAFAAESFDYFCDNARRMAMDPRRLPWEVAKYVVDLRRPIKERKWALSRYGRNANVGRLYTMVKYNLRFLQRGGSGSLPTEGASLEDIRRLGGVCHHRAVFASDVGKSVGVPTVYIHGATGSGYLHAWIGFLRKRGNGYVWDTSSGRIGNEKSSSVLIREPQEGRQVSEHELGFALIALKKSADSRTQARTWRRVALLLAEQDAKGAAAKAMRESLKAGVCEKWQWRACADLVRKGVFPAREVGGLVAVLNRALRPWPDLAVDAFDSLGGALDKDAGLRRRLCADMEKTYARNYAAVSRVHLLEGQWLEEGGASRDALKAYTSGLTRALSQRVDPLPLLDNASRLLIEGGDMKEAAQLHERALNRVRTPRRCALGFAVQTTKFQVGLRLAALYGRSNQASKRAEMIRRIVGYGRASTLEKTAFREILEQVSYDALNTSRAPTRAAKP